MIEGFAVLVTTRLYQSSGVSVHSLVLDFRWKVMAEKAIKAINNGPTREITTALALYEGGQE